MKIYLPDDRRLTPAETKMIRLIISRAARRPAPDEEESTDE